MTTSKETKLSLKEKLYQETLDEFAIKQSKTNRDWLIYQADFVADNIKGAVKFAIEKTYDALQSGGLTEAGQSLYDRRKDIEAHTANQVFDGLAECQIDTSRLAPEEALRAIIQREDIYWYWVLDGDKVDAVKKVYGVD